MSEDSQSRPQDEAGWVELGKRRRLDGDLDGAAAAFQRVIISGDPDESPHAAIEAGYLREFYGDLRGAAARYERAAATGHPTWAPVARQALESLRQREAPVRKPDPPVTQPAARPEERVVLDVVTRDRQGNDRRFVGTNLRLQLTGPAFLLDQVTSVGYSTEQESKTDQWGTVRRTTTYPVQRFFTAATGGTKFALQLGDEEPGARTAWRQLVAYSQQWIEPRVCQAIVADLRAGGTWTVMSAIRKKPEIELTSQGFVVHGQILGGEKSYAWSSLTDAELQDTDTLIFARFSTKSARGKSRKRGGICLKRSNQNGALLPTLMPLCKEAFG